MEMEINSCLDFHPMGSEDLNLLTELILHSDSENVYDERIEKGEWLAEDPLSKL